MPKHALIADDCPTKETPEQCPYETKEYNGHHFHLIPEE